MVLASRRVVFPDGVRPAAIDIQNGKISRVGDPRELGERTFVDFGDLVVSPGVVDTHVHVNEPGRTEWEGIDTATRAAAAGGVTTIVDMPLNSVPATTTVAALEAKRSAARGQSHVDVAFWGGVVPGNADELDALVDAGVRGFKCFLAPSGVAEFQHVAEEDLREAMPIIAKRGVPLLVHAEDPAYIAGGHFGPPLRVHDNPQGHVGADRSVGPYDAYLATRPPKAEVEAIRMVAALARETGARVHIVHVASEEAAAEVARAKREGVAMTAETCPHYLTFAAEEIPNGATEYKCAPPIREARHRQALWDALEAGTLDLVATDHSPSPPSMKPRGDFAAAWGGIASLELSLAAVATARSAEASRSKTQWSASLQASEVARWLSLAPARLAGLDGRKGRIAPGYDADLVVWDPDAETIVDVSTLQQRHKLTPYAGRRLRGVVHSTYVRGERVWGDGRLLRSGQGRLL